MIPVHLSLSGFLSYRSPVDLDFTGFSLACVSGSNGAGKSSLLDAITWALFGQARGRDESVVNTNEEVKRAEVIYDFQYEENLYRVQRIKPKGKTESLDFFVRYVNAEDGGGWKSLTEKSINATEAKIRQTLRMDYETFTNASFFLQGRADQFAQQRPGERKRILSNILGLDIWEEYRQRAADRRKAAEDEVLMLRTRVTEIDDELDEEDARKLKLSELTASLESISRQRADQDSIVQTARKFEATVTEQRKLVDALARQVQAGEAALEALTREFSVRTDERTGYQTALRQADEIEHRHAAWQQARNDLEGFEKLAGQDRELENRRAALATIIESTRSALAQEQGTLKRQQQGMEQIQNQIPEKKQVLGLLAEKSVSAADLTNQQKSLQDEQSVLQQEMADLNAENTRLRAEMAKLDDRIKRLDAVEGAQCPVCGQPLTADHRLHLLDEMGTQGKEMGDTWRRNRETLHQADVRCAAIKTELDGLAAALTEVHQSEVQAAALTAQIDQMEKQMDEWQAAGAPRLQQVENILCAEQYAPDVRAELAELDGQRKTLGYDPAAHEAARKSELTGRSSEMELRSLETARGALVPLESTLKSLENQIAQKKIEITAQQADRDRAEAALTETSTGLPDVRAAERALTDLKETENRIRMEVGAARQKVEVLTSLKARRKDLQEQVERVNHLTAHLKKLEKAFGKDGVPALLIEQALPEIQTEANDLLDRLSDGRMSVRFATQRDYKDKKRDDKKETLDILISDSSGTRDYELFSGGEAFRVNFAIRLAMSRVLAQRAGARLQTLVIDEGFGSQDAEGRQRLVETINQVKDDFAKILVITHLEELKDAFPTRIEVEKTDQGSMVTVMG
jgi:exonuclease SbcC